MSLSPLETLTLSDTPDTSAPRDRLTTLPPELFALVESFIYLETSTITPYSGSYLGSVSRAFLASARKHHFTDIWIRTHNSLRKFITAVTASEDTAVHTFDVMIDMYSASGDTDKGQISDEHLCSLLSKLVSLERLEVHYFPRFSKILADPPPWCQPLPSCQSLYLADQFLDWRNPFDRRYWTSLGRYPSLTEFHLSHCLPGFEPEPSSAPLLAFQPNNSITRLHLGGNNLCDNSSILYLFNLFPEVYNLSFDEKTDLVRSITSFLWCVPRPERIAHLTVPNLHEWDPEFPAALARFRGLRMVSLRRGVWQHPTVTDVLLSLKLVHVYVADKPDEQELIRFVKNASELEKFGLRADYNNPEPDAPVPLDLEQQLAQGWTETFTPEGVVEIARIARERGVATKGDIFRRAREIVEAKARRDEALSRAEEEARGG
ncbi:hypothetical protein JCM16303_003816 [Sporobolomyces ruberrimus]